MRTIFTFVVAGSAIAMGCARAPQYELRGQVLALDRGRQEVTIKHGDIPGLMPGMTMPFKVNEPRLFDGIVAGDLVKATLIIRDSTGVLTAIERTGHAPVAEIPPPSPDIIDVGGAAPDLQFTDETGASRTLKDWRGRILAVTFIYTRCPLPDFCPRMDRHFKAAQTEVLSDRELRDRVGLLSISFDPEFDTAPVLAAHAKEVGADPRVWHFATGDRSAIESFARRFGVSVIREGADAGSVTHNLRTAVIASDGTVVRMLNGNDWTVSELMAALRQAH